MEQTPITTLGLLSDPASKPHLSAVLHIVFELLTRQPIQTSSLQLTITLCKSLLLTLYLLSRILQT